MKNIYQSEFESRKKRVVFKECAVAGLGFHIEHDDDLWFELEVGTPLALIRQKNNEHDSNAVAVALPDDYNGHPDDFDFDFILGYVPRTANAELATMFDAGYGDKFAAKITELKRYGSYSDRIRITIYVESTRPEFVRPDLLRAQALTHHQLVEMTEELEQSGVVCLQLEELTDNDFAVPEVGEKIVMVNQNVVYLMRVLAVDEDCSNYIASSQLDDDTIQCVLTNIIGPVPFTHDFETIFEGIELSDLAATHYLIPEITNALTRAFNSHLRRMVNLNNMDMDPSFDGE